MSLYNDSTFFLLNLFFFRLSISVHISIHSTVPVNKYHMIRKKKKWWNFLHVFQIMNLFWESLHLKNKKNQKEKPTSSRIQFYKPFQWKIKVLVQRFPLQYAWMITTGQVWKYTMWLRELREKSTIYLLGVKTIRMIIEHNATVISAMYWGSMIISHDRHSNGTLALL